MSQAQTFEDHKKEIESVLTGCMAELVQKMTALVEKMEEYADKSGSVSDQAELMAFYMTTLQECDALVTGLNKKIIALNLNFEERNGTLINEQQQKELAELTENIEKQLDETLNGLEERALALEDVFKGKNSKPAAKKVPGQKGPKFH